MAEIYGGQVSRYQLKNSIVCLVTEAAASRRLQLTAVICILGSRLYFVFLFFYGVYQIGEV